MRIRFLIIILVFLFVQSAFAFKGRNGSYTLKFIMLDRKTELAIPDAFFIINNDTLKTDSMGTFLFVFKWQTICPSLIQGPLRRMKIRRRIFNCSAVFHGSCAIRRSFRSWWRPPEIRRRFSNSFSATPQSKHREENVQRCPTRPTSSVPKRRSIFTVFPRNAMEL